MEIAIEQSKFKEEEEKRESNGILLGGNEAEGIEGSSSSSNSTITTEETTTTATTSNTSGNMPDGYIDDDDDEDVCRICRTGSIKFVHQDCLLQWLNHSNVREVCKHPFSFSPVYAENAPTRLPFQEFVVGMAMKTCHVIQFFLRLAFVLFVWLLIIPFVTFWIWRLVFVRSLGEAQRLFMSHLYTTVVLTDCLHGFLLSASIDDKKYVVRAEYPWKPSYCSHCKSFGHSCFKCSSNTAPKYKKIWVPKSNSVDVVSRESEKNLESPEKNVDLNEEGLSIEGSESLIEEGPLMKSHEQSNAVMERVNGEGSVIPEIESSDLEYASVGLESGKDNEGFERVFRRRKGSDKNRELIRQENICNLSPFSSLENLEVDNSTDFIEASTSREGEVSVMDLEIEKDKAVFDTMSKEQKVERLINFSSMFVSGECSDEVKRSIFGDLAEKYQQNKKDREKSRMEKELEKLGMTGEESNEKLGRGQRSSIKKKY